MRWASLKAGDPRLVFTASEVPSMQDANTIATHAWPWLLLLAIVLWVLAFVLSQQRPEVLRRLGRWLAWVAIAQVVLLVVGPWLAVRYVEGLSIKILTL